MTVLINKKSAQGAVPNADFYKLSKTHFNVRNKRIQPAFPKMADPLFCTFDTLVAVHINRVGFCYLMRNRDYLTYDLTFSKGKDVWIFYFYEAYRELSINFGYELLRHGAMKVLVDWFPLAEVGHD